MFSLTSKFFHFICMYPFLAGIYFFKVSEGDIKKLGEIRLNLTIKTSFEQILHYVQVFPLLALNN